MRYTRNGAFATRVISVKAWALGALLLVTGSALGQFTFSYVGPKEIVVGPDCTAPLEWGHPNTPTAMSIDPRIIILNFDIVSISGGYSIGDPVPAGETVTVLYEATNFFGNEVMYGFNIAFTDTTAPVFVPSSLPADAAVTCGDLPAVANVQATDGCDDNPQVTLEAVTSGDVCGGGAIVRTWTATDIFGNTAQYRQTLSLVPDNQAPTFVVAPVGASASCGNAVDDYESWLNEQRNNIVVTDVGCGVEEITDNAPDPSVLFEFCGVIPVNFFAIDSCGNVRDVSVEFSVTNNTPPVIAIPASDASNDCSTGNPQQEFFAWLSNRGGSQATDDCSFVIWSTIPEFPTFDDVCDGAIEVTFVADDGCGNTASTTAEFQVNDQTDPSIESIPLNLLVSCVTGDYETAFANWITTQGGAVISDLCADDDEISVVMRLEGALIDSAGLQRALLDSFATGCRDGVILNGVLSNGVRALLEVEFEFRDKCGNGSTTLGSFGVLDQVAPTFREPPQDSDADCGVGDLETIFNAWYDNGGGAEVEDDCGEAEVYGNPDRSQAFEQLLTTIGDDCDMGTGVDVVFYAIDACGNLSRDSFSVSFSLVDTVTPTIVTQPANAAFACDGTVKEVLIAWLDTLGGAIAEDNCADIAWQFTWAENGQTMNGMPGLGPYPDSSLFECGVSLPITFIASDLCGNSSSAAATFENVDDTPPEITISQPEINIPCDSAERVLGVSAIDNCLDMPIMTFVDVPLGGGDGCPYAGSFTRIWTATDLCGNTGTAQQIVNLVDEEAPSLTVPVDITLACTQSTDPTTTGEPVGILDNCDDQPTVNFNDVQLSAGCDQEIDRQWIVVDACGNADTLIQRITVIDTMGPIPVSEPQDLIIDCAGADPAAVFNAWLSSGGSVAFFDSCGNVDFFVAAPGSYDLGDTSTFPGSVPVFPDSLTCPQNGSTLLSISADVVFFDPCYNRDRRTIQFELMDTSAPEIATCEISQEVEIDPLLCTSIFTIRVPDATDACALAPLQYSYSIDGESPISTDTGQSFDLELETGSHSIEFIIVDCVGNSATCAGTLVAADLTPPEITCPESLVFDLTEGVCDTPIALLYPPTATDNCDFPDSEQPRILVTSTGAVELDTMFTDQTPLLASFAVGVTEISYFLSDGSGNIDSCSLGVELRDVSPPVARCRDVTVMLSPTGNVPTLVSADDVDNGSADDCGIASSSLSRTAFACADTGVTHVMLTVIDNFGNQDTCQSNVVAEVEPLEPLFSIGLCDADTLNLFANAPLSQITPYNYLWRGPNGFSSDEANPVIPNISPTWSGEYTIMTTAFSACQATGTVNIRIDEFNSPTLQTDSDTICLGEPVILQATVYTQEVSYQWYVGAPPNQTLLGTTATPSFIFEPTQEGSLPFSVAVESDECMLNPSPLIVAEVVSAPEAIVDQALIQICEGEDFVLGTQVAGEDITYSWTGPNGFTSHLQFPPAVEGATQLDAGNYTLIVSIGDCASDPAITVVVVNATPDVPAISGDPIYCSGGQLTLTANTTSAVEQYFWISPGGVALPPASANVLQLPEIDTTDAGNWSIQVARNGCVSDTSQPFFVDIESFVLNASNTGPVCEMAKIQLLADEIPGVSYEWSGPGGFFSEAATPIIEAVAGVYHVEAVSSNGCLALDSTTVVVDQVPAISAVSSTADNCVDGMTDVTLALSPFPADDGSYTYEWGGPNGFTSQDASPVVPQYSSTDNGQYFVIVGNGTCTSDSAFIEIIANDIPPAPAFTVSQDSLCEGDSIILTAIGGHYNQVNYVWLTPTGDVTVEDDTVLILRDLGPEATGNYAVRAEVAGCLSAESAMQKATVTSGVSDPEIIAADVICENDTLLLTTPTQTGVDYQWSGPDGFTANSAETYVYPVTQMSQGIYSLRVVRGTCISSNTEHFAEVKAQPSAPVIAMQDLSICLDQPVATTFCIEQESATPGADYAWFNAISDDELATPGPLLCLELSDFSSFDEGTNGISVRAIFEGCSSEESVPLEFAGFAIPDQMADAGPDVVSCLGESVQLRAVSPAIGIGQWSSSDPQVVFSDSNDPASTVSGFGEGETQVSWTLSYATCTDFASDLTAISVENFPVTEDDSVFIEFGTTTEFGVIDNDIAPSDFSIEVLMDPAKGNMLGRGDGNFVYSPDLGYVGPDMFVYEICSEACPDQCEIATVTLQVGEENDCFVPSIFTPNSDGVNDLLIIPCLETGRFPGNKVLIFNQWGDTVFEGEPYNNDWDGKRNGDDVPVSTYYYVVDFGDGTPVRKGFIIIER